MANHLTDITEGQPLDSIQNVYMTHTTIMKNLIDSDSYDRMMVQVVKDIMDNDDILEKIKGLKRKQRFFLGEIIYKWADMNWGNHFTTNRQHSRAVRRHKVSSGPSPWNIFDENFEEAFGRDVHWECEYLVKAFHYEVRITNPKKNEFDVMLNYNNMWSKRDVEARLVAKYNEEKNTLKVCYIEHQGGKWRTKFCPKMLRPELFKGVKQIINHITEEKGNKPQLICAKKYLDVYEDAKRRKYLEDPKQEDDFVL